MIGTSGGLSTAPELSPEVQLPVHVAGRTFAARATAVRVGADEFLFLGTPTRPDVPLVRLHSGCLTGDVFRSERCDCGPQLERAWGTIIERGGGVLYAPGHEGRGIGLFNKILAYRLQEDGVDTFEANRQLGFPDDARDFASCAAALRVLGHPTLDLLTNNPAKKQRLEAHGVLVRNVVPLIAGVSAHNRAYLEAKRDLHGHLLGELFPGSDAPTRRRAPDT